MVLTLSTTYNLPSSFLIRFKIGQDMQQILLQNVNNKRMSNFVSLCRMPSQYSSPMLDPSFYKTSNKLRCQCLELLQHLDLFLNHHSYLPLLNLNHNPWLQYHLPNLRHHHPLKTNDDVIQFFYLQTHFLVITKEGEIGIFLSCYISLLCFFLYTCHFLATLELKESLTTLHSLL